MFDMFESSGPGPAGRHRAEWPSVPNVAEDGVMSHSPKEGQDADEFHDEDVLNDELISADESAKAAVVGLFFSYPERKHYIWQRVRDLWGRLIPEIETTIREELEVEMGQILAEREERLRLIQNQGTRDQVVPLTRHEARLAAACARRDEAVAEAEAANMSWLQKKAKFVQSIRRAWEKVVAFFVGIFRRRSRPDKGERSSVCMASPFRAPYPNHRRGHRFHFFTLEAQFFQKCLTFRQKNL
jgi:hypothetical protein